MNKKVLAGALALGAISLLTLGRAVNAQTTAVLPIWEIKSGSTILGFFISDTGGDIIIGMKDGSTTAPVKIRKSGNNVYLEGNEPRVFYTGTNCSGTVYVNDHLSSEVKAGAIILGATYGVGQQPSNPSLLQLYKGTGVAVPDPGLQSLFINGSCSNGAPFGSTFRIANSIFSFPFGTPIPAGSITME